jgi:catalase
MTQTEVRTETDPYGRVLDGLDANFGVEPRRRAAHAKGVVAYGSFTATPAASTISRAGHLAGPPVEVVARFSNFPGGASHPDAAPESNPRGLAVQFRLADGTTTDLLAHSINGFPGRTVEDFGDFLFAIAPDGPGPEAYLADHPAAAAFVGAIQTHGAPASYATLRYYPVNAFLFHDVSGATKAGRYTFEPTEGVRLLTDDEIASVGQDYLADELARRLDADAVVFSLMLTIAEPGDPTDDANAQWPADRRQIELGRLRLQRLADDSETAQEGLFFDPVRLVDGISLSDDPLLVGRTRTYPLSLARRHQ